ncbi:hypothetical protein [Ruegeria intermedia]|nr:hypothetical protein [Ruegeria intermedia]
MKFSLGLAVAALLSGYSILAVLLVHMLAGTCLVPVGMGAICLTRALEATQTDEGRAYSG